MESAWKCDPWTAVVDDLPIFRAKKLEKLWVDMNNLTITEGFFDKVVEAWPEMRTLDLYDNNVHVNVANVVKLKKLPNMQQLLLQNNRVYGTMDSNFFEGWQESWRNLNLVLNRDLQGRLTQRD